MQQKFLSQIANQCKWLKTNKKNSTGLVGCNIGFITAEFPSQSYIDNYVIRGHIDIPLTLPENLQ